MRVSSDSYDTTGTSSLFIKSVSRRTTTSRTRLSRIVRVLVGIILTWKTLSFAGEVRRRIRK